MKFFICEKAYSSLSHVEKEEKKDILINGLNRLMFLSEYI